PALVALPTFRWNEQTLLPHELCSLAGQRDNLENQDDLVPQCDDPTGNYLSYRFLDVIGADGLPDLVTSFNYSGAVFDPADALSDPACDPGNYSSQCDLPLEWVQECTPDDRACPDFDEGLLDGMPEVCESVVDGTERYQVCHIDQSAIDAALDTAGDVPCGLLLGAGASVDTQNRPVMDT